MSGGREEVVAEAADVLRQRGESESLMWGALNLSDEIYHALAAALANAGLLALDAAAVRTGQADGEAGVLDEVEREARLDNADLARQLTDASRRRADAYDEGYDKAMRDAHHVLNQRGYLERRGDDNGNPYRAAAPDTGRNGEGGEHG